MKATKNLTRTRPVSTERVRTSAAQMLAEVVWLQINGQLGRADARRARDFVRWLTAASKRWER